MDLFALFNSKLSSLNLIVHQGRIVDASFVEVPRQRNTKEENDQIKNGEIPESISKNPAKQSQKDTDARWTKKHNVSYYGYKNHVKVDVDSKLILQYEVTDASVHDSQLIENLLDKSDYVLLFYADSAYTGAENEKSVTDRKMKNLICEKGYKNKPLTELQKLFNREKSRVRSRVEHVFGFIENSMKGMYLQNIGKKRIEGIIGLMNLTYNMFRKIQLRPI